MKIALRAGLLTLVFMAAGLWASSSVFVGAVPAEAAGGVTYEDDYQRVTITWYTNDHDEVQVPHYTTYYYPLLVWPHKGVGHDTTYTEAYQVIKLTHTRTEHWPRHRIVGGGPE